MDRQRLKELGYDLGPRAPGGLSQGAWFATASDGAAVVLKWSRDPGWTARYAALLPALEQLRARGAAVPRYRAVVPFAGGTLSVQERLPGRSEDTPPAAVVRGVLDCVAAQVGLGGPPPAATPPAWGAFVVQTLAAGRTGWAAQPHAALRTWDRRSARALERIEAVGASADPGWFPDRGLVHLDLHTDNVLVHAGALSGIIDWDDACLGDPRYDLVQFVFDLDGHGQPRWELVDDAGLEPRVVRAYLALLVLKCTSAAIRHRPDDVPRQLDRAERVFARYRVGADAAS